MSTSKTVKSNIYLTSPSSQNDTTSDKFINNTYEVDVPSIYNEWEDCARSYEEYYLNSFHNRYKKQTLEQHVQSLNKIFSNQVI